MKNCGMSCRVIVRQLGYHYTVIIRLIQKINNNNMSKLIKSKVVQGPEDLKQHLSAEIG